MDKDDPDKVLDKFEKYFKPAHNKYHSWYTLGTIYSSQFKGQSEFMVKLHDVIRECGFDHAAETEIVKFFSSLITKIHVSGRSYLEI